MLAASILNPGFSNWLAESACRQILSRTIFIGRWQMADGSWGERPELPARCPVGVASLFTAISRLPPSTLNLQLPAIFPIFRIVCRCGWLITKSSSFSKTNPTTDGHGWTRISGFSFQRLIFAFSFQQSAIFSGSFAVAGG